MRVIHLFLLFCFLQVIYALDLYKIIGVSKTATEKEIKKAYRKKALTMHPDKLDANQDIEKAKEEFMLLVKAYEILSDKKKRQEYDDHGLDDDLINQDTGAYTDYKFTYKSFSKKYTFEFEYTPKQKTKASTITINLFYSLEQFYNGFSSNVTYQYYDKCIFCHGTGTLDFLHYDKCKRCHGTGYANYIHYQSHYGSLYTTKCDVCQGSGSTSHSCPYCHGNKVVLNNNTYSFVIRPRSSVRSTITLENYGHFEFLKNRGDVQINLLPLPHEHYTVLENKHLQYQLAISLLESYTVSDYSIYYLNRTNILIHSPLPIKNSIWINCVGLFIIDTELLYPHLGLTPESDLFVTIVIHYPEYIHDTEFSIYKRILPASQLDQLVSFIQYQYILSYHKLPFITQENIDNYLYTYYCTEHQNECDSNPFVFFYGNNPFNTYLY